uniref:Uncharacterized protein n=1 Tax=Panagrolaimus davidi TaxID=227884 RepID=A0A914NX38_9BILA
MNSRKYILSTYPLQLQINFIDLYKVEIINRLDQNANLWKEFNCIVGDAVIEEYLSAHIDAESREIKLDKELYQSLCVDKWKSETFSSTFQKFLIVLHKIRPVFDIKNVVCNLKQYSSELGKHYQPVIERWEKKNIDDEYTKSLISRTFCILTDGATYHLLYAIYNSNKKAKEFIENIYPDFEIFYQKNIFEQRDGRLQ